MLPTYLFSSLQLHPDVYIWVLPSPHLWFFCSNILGGILLKNCTSHLNYYKSWLECGVSALDSFHLRKNLLFITCSWEKHSQKLAFFLSSSLTSRAIFFFESVVVIVLIFSIGHTPLMRLSRMLLSWFPPSSRFLVRPRKQPVPPLPKPTIAVFNIFQRIWFLKYEFWHVWKNLPLGHISSMPLSVLWAGFLSLVATRSLFL